MKSFPPKFDHCISARGPRHYWNQIPKFKRKCLAATTLQELLQRVLEGISGVNSCGNCNCMWFQISGFNPKPELEPSDIALLDSLKAADESALLKTCFQISDRKVLWSKNDKGLLLEYASSGLDDEQIMMFRIGDMQHGMDQWILVESRQPGFFISEDIFFLESFVEMLASIYLERANWFNINRRLSVQFDHAFEQASQHIVFDHEALPIEYSDRCYAMAEPSDEEMRLLHSILLERLSLWNRREKLTIHKQTRVTSFAFRLGHHDMVALVKYDASRCQYRVVLNRDSVQSRRSVRARQIFTKRQFEAFLHFENGCVSAEDLSAKMGISPRTAEHYRSIILYHLEKELNFIPRDSTCGISPLDS